MLGARGDDGQAVVAARPRVRPDGAFLLFSGSPPLSPSFLLGICFDAPRVFAPSTALSRGRRKRAGRERGKKIAFFFFLLRGGGGGGTHPQLPCTLALLFLPFPPNPPKTLLGSGASVVLDGQRVLPSRATAQGFAFKHGRIGEALRNLYR